ncbi:ATPase SWSAP1 [Molossus molossus]|uniref:SWIM-type zinc finger 7 associated protein 1 n=1 Tax=Molossus molossus TaxID=27622 RepID=A0A7J8ICH3_MOLMO|nr:ATPase SWSAP1 [Molossus molossus]KAF6482297.1 SWIM-type zinc finger 7 associated protein 1 [Molossus molossus]
MAETLRRVLSSGRAAGPGEDIAAEPGPPLLLLGGPGSGKTALLFAAALEAAGEGRGPVLFLTRRPLQSLPRRTPAALDPLRLQKIRFQYPPSTHELLRLLCSAHEAPGPAPFLLLIDGLEEYLAEDLKPQEAAYLAALLLDTAAHFSHQVGPGRGCGLIVALQTQEEGDSGDALQLSLLQKYFLAQCWLQRTAPGSGHRCFRACLEPGGLGPREEWCVAFQPDGEMRITPWPTQAGDPRSDKSSSCGGQPCLSFGV